MKVVFSFCIYGEKKKYCQGMIENLELIQQYYPEANVYIYYYHDVPSDYIQQYQSYSNVSLRTTPNFQRPNMVDRFFVLEDDPSVDVVLIRDSDSRIHARDRSCINHFLESAFLCHTVRDHHLHHSPILGGLWGMKQGALDVDMRQLYEEYISHVQTQSPIHEYGHDMFFLRYCVYPRVVKSMVVYTFGEYLRLNPHETLILLPSMIMDGNFCGQVIDYDAQGHEVQQYTFPV